jgi:uncharacterized membrane protein
MNASERQALIQRCPEVAAVFEELDGVWHRIGELETEVAAEREENKELLNELRRIEVLHQ